MEVKPILRVIPGLQATALVGYNLNQTQKMFNMKKGNMGLKKPIKSMVKMGVVNLAGVGLLKPTANIIESY